ncbi:hypothetical protein FHX75_111404 [Micromonospora palomenae]|uniref:Uncharacterized protein n=1 Tax=Micromonospora palomenae TaxID=1461247 RepID=A0A561WWL3_9ACTN|nr:hypothetical protein FHX75_111404 [Micromonospora palomenae]
MMERPVEGLGGDGDGEYDFTLLTGSADNTRSALIAPA